MGNRETFPKRRGGSTLEHLKCRGKRTPPGGADGLWGPKKSLFKERREPIGGVKARGGKEREWRGGKW